MGWIKDLKLDKEGSEDLADGTAKRPRPMAWRSQWVQELLIWS